MNIFNLHPQMSVNDLNALGIRIDLDPSKDFSIIETPLGDFKLSPAQDLLNSRIHIEDKDFALDEGLIPARMGQDNIPK